MRILITIPHFFNPQGNGRYGSTKANPQPRIAAFTQALRNLYTLYAGAQEYWYRNGERLQPSRANDCSTIALDIVVCTCQEYHLLEQLVLPPDLYEQHPVECEPLQLGFACHDILRQRLGDYDLYGYMEDDLILHDPSFFGKLHYVRQCTGEQVVLQPNRFERYGTTTEFKKVYIDFEWHPPIQEPQDDGSTVALESLGQSIILHRATNSHAGCFFLSQAQMAHWAAQEYFADRDASFIGPLESAATLGLMRTFQIYKPAPRNANFLEIEHYGQVWSHQMAAVRFAPPRPSLPLR